MERTTPETGEVKLDDHQITEVRETFDAMGVRMERLQAAIVRTFLEAYETHSVSDEVMRRRIVFPAHTTVQEARDARDRPFLEDEGDG